MKKEQKFAVWRTGLFSDEPNELIAHFYDLEAAKDFTDYQATIGNGFVVLQDNKKIYPEE